MNSLSSLYKLITKDFQKLTKTIQKQRISILEAKKNSFSQEYPFWYFIMILKSSKITNER